MNNVWAGKQEAYILNSVKNMLCEGFLETGIWSRLNGLNIIVKPNLTAAIEATKGKTTHPIVTRALAELLNDAGARKIIIAESSQVGTNTWEAVEKCGYGSFPRRGFPVINLDEKPVKTCKVKGTILKRVDVFEPILNADIIVSAAKLKTIYATPVSLCCKNMKGVIPDKEKKRFHRIGLDMAVADLLTVLPPILGLVDGIQGLSLQAPVDSKVMVLGDNPVSVDAVAASIIGLHPRDIKHLVLASELGVGEIDLEGICSSGEDLKNLQTASFEWLQGVDDLEGLYNINIIDGKACSGCVGVLLKGLESAKEKGYLSYRSTIALGPCLNQKDLPPDAVILGNCAKKFKGDVFLPGCPSRSVDITNVFRKKHGKGCRTMS